MKKILMQKITQHGKVCYIGRIDPRLLVRIAAEIEIGEVQDAQRPLNGKRIKDIAKYVNEKNGILPNTITIASKDNKISIKECDNELGLYYCELPDKEQEFEYYKNSIDVMDGQHRLYSFLPDHRILPDSDIFEIGFTLYDKPTISDKRQIFISCNEKQEKVSSNLLMWFKNQLNMLTDDEKNYFEIVSSLSNEEPLKGHIIMSAEKIKNGVKSKEIINDLKKAKILSLSSNNGKLSNDQIINVIRTYLFSWEKVCGFDFAESSAKEAGVAIKMAGLKYMIYVLPAVWDHAITSRCKFTEDFVNDTLRRLISQFNVPYETFFKDGELNKNFRDRTMIIDLAERSTSIIKKLGSEEFDPLA